MRRRGPGGGPPFPRPPDGHIGVSLLAKQRGIERGIEQGKLAACRRMLGRLLEDRFGRVPDELRQQINETLDLDRLEHAILHCPRLRSLAELQL